MEGAEWVRVAPFHRKGFLEGARAPGGSKGTRIDNCHPANQI